VANRFDLNPPPSNSVAGLDPTYLHKYKLNLGFGEEIGIIELRYASYMEPW